MTFRPAGCQAGGIVRSLSRSYQGLDPRLSPTLAPFLVEQLNQPKRPSFAFDEALVAIADPSIEPTLTACLERSEASQAASACAKALGRLRTKSSLEVLTEALRGHNEQVRRAVRRRRSPPRCWPRRTKQRGRPLHASRRCGQPPSPRPLPLVRVHGGEGGRRSPEGAGASNTPQATTPAATPHLILAPTLIVRVVLSPLRFDRQTLGRSRPT